MVIALHDLDQSVRDELECAERLIVAWPLATIDQLQNSIGVLMGKCLIGARRFKRGKQHRTRGAVKVGVLAVEFDDVCRYECFEDTSCQLNGCRIRFMNLMHIVDMAHQCRVKRIFLMPAPVPRASAKKRSDFYDKRFGRIDA